MSIFETPVYMYIVHYLAIPNGIFQTSYIVIVFDVYMTQNRFLKDFFVTEKLNGFRQAILGTKIPEYAAIQNTGSTFLQTTGTTETIFGGRVQLPVKVQEILRFTA